MQIIGGTGQNPGNGTIKLATGAAQMGGVVILHNLSPYDCICTFLDTTTASDSQRQAILHAWQPRKFDFCGRQTAIISIAPAYTPPAGVTQNAPTSFIWGESFEPGEAIPDAYPNYDRISNVGNTVTTQGGSANVKNDNNAPGTQVIEATPSDQTQSSLSDNNDGSGLRKILSANVLRQIWSFVRGNNTTGHASVQIGDPSETTMTSFAGRAANSDFLQNDQGAPYALTRAGTAGNRVDFEALSRTTDHAHQYNAAIDASGNYGVYDVTNGGWAAFVNNTLPVANLSAGTLPATVACPAANITPGTLASGAWVMAGGSLQLPGGMKVYLNGGTQTDWLGRGLNGTEADVELRAADNLSLEIANNKWDKLNNYYDGVNDRFLNATGYASQLVTNQTTISNLPVPGIRWSSAASTAIGAIIASWGAWHNLATMASQGGGAAGITTWVGTTDPGGNAVEGDLWVNDQPGTANANYGAATGSAAPSGGWNGYGASANQAWVDFLMPNTSGYVTAIWVYMAGASGTVIVMHGCVWDTAGNILAYDTGSGVNLATTGTGAVGGQSWSGSSGLPTSGTGSTQLQANTHYRVGIYRTTGNTAFWSANASVNYTASPGFTNSWGYASGATAVAQNLQTGFTPGYNGPIQMGLTLNTGGTPHMYIRRASGWRQIV